MQAVRLSKVQLYQMVMLLALIFASVWLVGAESAATRVLSRAEQNALKAQIRANPESAVKSNFMSHVARVDQISGGYNPDVWEVDMLHKGELVYGGLPVQTSYYTDLDAVLASQGDKDVLGRSLQIERHPIKGYRAKIGVYEFVRDAHIPKGLVLENPELGPGNTAQYFIKNYSHLLELKHEYTLEEFYESQLSPRKFSP